MLSTDDGIAITYEKWGNAMTDIDHVNGLSRRGFLSISAAGAALTTVQAQLAPMDFDRAFATGQQLSLTEAFAMVLRLPETGD